ncbi:MAG: type II toxin-antitoxin system VapC family toxin [Rhodothermales bacterium]
MNAPVLLDTGPLVAALDERDYHHKWAYAQFGRLPFPFLTCEAVLTEAAHLLRRSDIDAGPMFGLLRSGAIRIDYNMQPEVEVLQALVARYANVPMDLADACLVRLSERNPQSRVLTLDSDFYIYRTEAGAALDVLSPR